MSNLRELKAVQSRLVKDRKKAEAEVKKIDSTLQKIESAIAELQGTSKREKGASPKNITCSRSKPCLHRAKPGWRTNSKSGSKGAVGRRTWTEEQKREAAERMKRVWAKKKKGKKGRADKAEDPAEGRGESGGEARVVVPPQAVA